MPPCGRCGSLCSHGGKFGGLVRPSSEAAAGVRAHTHTDTRKQTHKLTHTRKHTQTHTHTKNTKAHTHTPKHTQNTHTHTHQTHTHQKHAHQKHSGCGGLLGSQSGGVVGHSERERLELGQILLRQYDLMGQRSDSQRSTGSDQQAAISRCWLPSDYPCAGGKPCGHRHETRAARAAVEAPWRPRGGSGGPRPR